MQHEQLFDTERASRLLSAIHEGMAVIDRENHDLGSVDFVYMGSDADEDASAVRDDTFVEDFAEALVGTDPLPEVLYNRLMQHGYIRIDGGLMGPTRYAMPDQIAAIRDDRVVLGVEHDELVKR